MTNLLVVDDEPNLLVSLQGVLEDAGYSVTMASEGQEALRLLERRSFDLMILDIIMPGLDGIEVCHRVRSDPFLAALPILFLTAKARPADIAQGLDSGADDYLIKPFDVIELPARVRALLRRVSKENDDSAASTLRYERLCLSTTRPEAQIEGRTVRLTPIEHRLLYYFLRNMGRPTPTEQLLKDVWGYLPHVGDPQLVRVHVTNLRTKLGFQPDEPEFIHNLHGRGYLIANS